MSAHRLRRLAIGCLLGFSFAAAATKALADDLSIPGSGNLEYVLGEIAKAFNNQQHRHRVTVPPSTGTAGAIRDVEQGVATLGRVGRPLKETERNQGLAFVPLGRDAVVFVAGAGVSLRSVTTAKMIDAFTGKTSDWRELGGKPGPVRVIGREATDASIQAIARQIKPFANIRFADSAKLVHLDPQMIELLDRFPTSLGFLNRSQLFAAKTKLVPLALDGIEPSPENLASGRYPIWLEFGLIYRHGALTEAGRAFLQFLETPAAAGILREHGVLPLVSPAE
jgi:phosphate transport system substrate-binding protein